MFEVGGARPLARALSCARCFRYGSECIPREQHLDRKRRKISPVESRHVAQSVLSLDPEPACSEKELLDGLDHYLHKMAHYFPFVLIPPTSPRPIDSVKGKNFLSLVIAMLGCTQTRSRQLELAGFCRRYIAKNAIEAGEKSLDLLQGLLLFVHW
jgi:hypothetical protein